MNVSHIREPGNFGKRAELPTVVITKNGKSRSFVIRPGLLAALGGLFFMFMVGYFGATAYLIFHDDLLGASQARHARAMHEYEDRIAALRTKLDQVTSRQLLDQKAIEAKVADLVGRQETLAVRGGRMEKLLTRAKSNGLKTSSFGKPAKVVPQKRPAKKLIKTSQIDVQNVIPLRGELSGLLLRGFSNDVKTVPTSGTLLASNTNPTISFSNNGVFGQVANDIIRIETSQIATLDGLRTAAQQKTVKIVALLEKMGIPVQKSKTPQIGGPFIPADASVDFTGYLDALDFSLSNLDEITRKAKSFPFANPLPGQKTSSRFGLRRDPFNGRRAVHSGLDFRGKRGMPVFATASGTVIHAGRKGGYGKMVEIRHAGGYTTRYAHLSRYFVKKGQKVQSGKKIGAVGSTGRSTGPHLHYEVRRNDVARNPSHYLNAGRRLKKLL